jgi:tripartite-type tricarboxylate transporter receptor subunit TctC
MQVPVRYLLVALIALMPAPPVWAQAWPSKAIRVVVNFPAGGTTDMMARAFTQKLSDTLGQPVVIENRGGAGGTVGMEVVARAAPDGYTLLASSGSPVVVGPHLYKLNFDVGRDLTPIAPMGRILTILVVRPTLPVKTTQELIAYMRANPGKLNYGSVGSGSTLHIHAERMLRATKTQATHIPYKGAAELLTSLLGSQVDFAFDSGLTIPHIKSDKLRLLAVVAATRSPLFPDTPTLLEAGIEAEGDALFGVYAPAGISRDIVLRLNREIGRIMQTPEARAVLANFAAEVATAGPDEFAAIQTRDREKFGAFIREANIRAD